MPDGRRIQSNSSMRKGRRRRRKPTNVGEAFLLNARTVVRSRRNARAGTVQGPIRWTRLGIVSGALADARELQTCACACFLLQETHASKTHGQGLEASRAKSAHLRRYCAKIQHLWAGAVVIRWRLAKTTALRHNGPACVRTHSGKERSQESGAAADNTFWASAVIPEAHQICSAHALNSKKHAAATHSEARKAPLGKPRWPQLSSRPL